MQARLCLQTCVLRDTPPTVLWELQGQGREEQSREAELGSQVLLPLLWECCWQLLLLPACPFLLPRMSELKNTPYTHMQGGLHRPCRAQDVAPELQPGNKLLSLLYVPGSQDMPGTVLALRLPGGRGLLGAVRAPRAAAGLGGGACSWSGHRAGWRC